MIRQTISDECFRSGRSVTKEHLEELVQSEYMRVRHVPKVPEVQGNMFKCCHSRNKQICQYENFQSF